jgi:hypothetical protein
MTKKILSIFLSTMLLLQAVAIPAFAAPDLPSAPDLPGETETTESPQTPDSPNKPESKDTNQDEPEDNNEESQEDESTSPTEKSTNQVETPETPNKPGEKNNSGTSKDSKIGDVAIETGDASADGKITNTGNTNASATPQVASGVQGISIVNDKNGTNSDNSGSVLLQDGKETIQINDANLDNKLVVNSTTGENSASKNVGNSSIETGEAHATGTIFNSVNTNVDGIIISEFNVADDHVGDYVLDFVNNCVSGCGNIGVQNSGNGSDSENAGEVDLTLDNYTFQQNDASIENELVLTANSGNNTAANNTGGDSEIKTGDANASGSVLNFANNNFAGDVIYAVVNIFGDLTGDLIISEESLKSLGFGDVNLQNTKNGTDSVNIADVDATILDEFTQVNDADIVNNLNLGATTGGNSASNNTDGDSYISTGNANVDAQVINIANANHIGGDWWIVLVNEAGNWFGKILGVDGAVVGNNFAASSGTGFEVASDGTINITNQENGSGSTNIGDVAMSSTNTTYQENNAQIANNITINANTGGNSTSRNTGGDNSSETGDANVMLNLVNFVNNNFAGGNVFLSVVNVFGTWTGDFLTPGAVKAQEDDNKTNENAIGGVTHIPSTPSNNDNSDGSGDHNDSSSGSGDTAANDSEDSTDVGTLLGSAASTSRFTTGASSSSIAQGDTDKITEPLTLGDSADASKKTINLAYTLLVLPLGAGYIAYKRGLLAAILARFR